MGSHERGHRHTDGDLVPRTGPSQRTRKVERGHPGRWVTSFSQRRELNSGLSAVQRSRSVSSSTKRLGRAVAVHVRRRCHVPSLHEGPIEVKWTLVVGLSPTIVVGLTTKVSLHRPDRPMVMRWRRGQTWCMGGSWLDRGHGDGESLVQVAGAPARGMVRVSDRASASWNSRSTKVIVGALATAALIGSAGTAYAIRETLFPTLGAPTSRSVWSNPVPVEEPVEVTVAAVTTSTSTVPPVTAVPASPAPAPASATATSVEDHAGTVDAQVSGSGTSGRRGSASNTVPDVDDSGSEEHATTTETVSNTGPTVPESGSGGVATTEASGSGRGSSGSGSGSDGDSDNSGSGHSGSDDDGSDSDDRSGRDDDRSGRDDRSDSDDRSASED